MLFQGHSLTAFPSKGKGLRLLFFTVPKTPHNIRALLKHIIFIRLSSFYWMNALFSCFNASLCYNVTKESTEGEAKAERRGNMKTTLYFIAFFTLILMAAMTFETSGATLYKAGVEAYCQDVCKQ